ncbi:MAG: NAD(P)H-dependent oxidoreductase [Bacteroidota bacterium]
MTTVISGTNRSNSRTLQIAKHLAEYLNSKDEAVRLLDLSALPNGWISPEMYSPDGQSRELRKWQERYINDADRFIIVTPEYNGGYTGLLKLFIDAISVHRYAENFTGKWTALVGVASGRSGNLRGLDQLTQSLLYMGGHVLPGVLPISQVNSLIDETGSISDESTRESLNKLADRLVQI